MYNDPLLRDTSYQRPDTLASLEEERKQLEDRISRYRNSSIHAQNQPQAPVWDEIDTIVSGLSEQEYQFICSNQEFQDSNNNVQALLQREYLRIMRPIVENTKDGKQALENHLTIVKRLRGYAREEVNKKNALLDEYLENYSDRPFSEFMEMKRGKKKGGNSK